MSRDSQPAPVTLISAFEVPAAHVGEFIAQWRERAAMRRQMGPSGEREATGQTRVQDLVRHRRPGLTGRATRRTFAVTAPSAVTFCRRCGS